MDLQQMSDWERGGEGLVATLTTGAFVILFFCSKALKSKQGEIVLRVIVIRISSVSLQTGSCFQCYQPLYLICIFSIFKVAQPEMLVELPLNGTKKQRNKKQAEVDVSLSLLGQQKLLHCQSRNKPFYFFFFP